MRPTGLSSSQRLDVGRRPAGPSLAARLCALVGILIVIAAVGHRRGSRTGDPGGAAADLLGRRARIRG